jgi:CBS domain-containing protein
MNYRDNSTEFLAIYDELDEYMRNQLNVDDNVPHRNLIERLAKKNNIFAKYKDNLVDFAKLRNAIVHNPYRGFAEPIAEPHNNIVELYRNIKIKIINPPMAIDISVKIRNIFCASASDNVMEVMRVMSQNTFSHVPIVKNGRVLGIFSQFAIFSYLVKNQSVCLDSNVIIKDFEEFTSLERHDAEYFEFVSRDTLASEIESMFRSRNANQKRLGVVFVTESGSQTEKLLGMITAVDLARYVE